jgi:hypothetical protein
LVTNVAPNLSECFFVGDAAGRGVPKAGGDHSDSDLVFAQSVNMAFYTETNYFPLASSAGASVFDLQRLGGKHMVVVLCGRPGSGKTLFAEAFRHQDEWDIVSQDELGTRPKCEEAVREALGAGRNCLVDRA